MGETGKEIAKFDVNFDKNDVVVVAIAKIENKIRKEIRNVKSDIAAIDKQITALDKEITRESKKTVPGVLVNKKDILTKALKDTNLDDALEMDVETSAPQHHDGENYHKLIVYKLDKHKKRHHGDVIEDIYIAQTDRQKEIYDEIKAHKERREQRLEDGVNFKRQLQEVPAAERQMRAIVVEDELRKTEEGTRLVQLLEEKYENTIKELEI